MLSIYQISSKYALINLIINQVHTNKTMRGIKASIFTDIVEDKLFQLGLAKKKSPNHKDSNDDSFASNKIDK
jgi:hypothetical protein